MSNVVPFEAPRYTAEQFAVMIGGKQWLVSGTLCGHIDVATPSAGTYCLSPDEASSFIRALQGARVDVLRNSRPYSDPRIIP